MNNLKNKIAEFSRTVKSIGTVDSLIDSNDAKNSEITRSLILTFNENVLSKLYDLVISKISLNIKESIDVEEYIHDNKINEDVNLHVYKYKNNSLVKYQVTSMLTDLDRYCYNEIYVREGKIVYVDCVYNYDYENKVDISHMIEELDENLSYIYTIINEFMIRNVLSFSFDDFKDLVSQLEEYQGYYVIFRSISMMNNDINNLGMFFFTWNKNLIEVKIDEFDKLGTYNISIRNGNINTDIEEDGY